MTKEINNSDKFYLEVPRNLFDKSRHWMVRDFTTPTVDLKKASEYTKEEALAMIDKNPKLVIWSIECANGQLTAKVSIPRRYTTALDKNSCFSIRKI